LAGDDDAEVRARARRGVRGWVRGIGHGVRRATPYGILAFLTASVVAPIAAPSLGADGEFGAILDQLGAMGSDHLSGVLRTTAERMRDRDGEPTADQWRDAVAEELLARLDAADEGAQALRGEIAELLRAVGAVRVAVDESAKGDEELRRRVDEAFATMAGSHDELRWLVVEAHRVQTSLIREIRAEQQVHLDLTRSLVTDRARPTAPADPDREPAADLPCPYPGLRNFQPEDAEWFHGRDAVVTRLLGRLTEQLDGAGPLVVVGVSGVGKSSVLRAGLRPAVAAGRLTGDAASWPWLTLTPGAAPLDDLAARTAALGGLDTMAAVEEVRAGPHGYGEVAARTARALGSASGRAVILVDQFEELFTLCADPAERDAFVTAMTNAAPALVVLAVRADFYPQCTTLPGLVPLLSGGQVVVGGLTEAELREAVREPAARAGLDVQPELVDLLVGELGAGRPGGYDPGSLPLLAHALRATFDERQGRTMTTAGYVRTGGIDGAVRESAEGIYADLGEPARAALRAALLRMVAIADTGDGGTAVVRRRTDRAGIDPDVLDRLVAARLVTVDRTTMQISHEALLRAWPRLADWVDADRRGLLIRQQLTDAADYWAGAGEDDGALYRGGRLLAATEWAAGRADLTPAESRFLTASTTAAGRRSRLMRSLTSALALLLVVAVAAGLVAFLQRNDAEQRGRESRSRQLAAQAMLSLNADPRGTMVTALAAWRLNPTPDARGAVLSAQMVGYQGQLGTELGGISVAVDPQATTLVVGGAAGRIRVWDLTTREPLGVRLEGHTGPLRWVGFSPDGGLLATAAIDAGGIKVWDMPSGRLRHTLPGIAAAAWSPDGTVLATADFARDGGEAATIRLWEPRSGAAVGTIDAGDGLVTTLAHSADGRLAAGRLDRETDIWQAIDGGTRLATLTGQLTDAQETAFNRDGLLATSGRGAAIQLWDATGREVGRMNDIVDDYVITGLVFSPGGDRLYTAGGGPGVRTWSVPERAEAAELVGEEGNPTDVSISADGRTVVATGPNNPTLMWKQNRSWLPALGSGAVVDVAFDPTGSELRYAGAGVVRTWTLDSGAFVDLTGGATLGSIASAADGATAVALADGTVRVFEADGRERGTLPAEPGGLGDLTFSPDGTLLAATTPWGSGIDSGLDEEQPVNAVHVWDAATLRPLGVLDLGEFDPVEIAFTPDSSAIVAAALKADIVDFTMQRRSIARVWRTDDLAGERTIELGDQQVVALAISPDGRTLATGGTGRTIALRDLDTGHLRTELGAHPAGVRLLAFSPDGSTLASGTTADPVIRLWDPATGQQVAGLTGHVSASNDLAFAPDGRTLATGSTDGSTAVWNLDVGLAVERICQALAGADLTTEWAALGLDPDTRPC